MFPQGNALAEAPLGFSRMGRAGFWDGMGTFEGVLVYDEQVVHFHLLSEGCLVRSCAAGKQLAGAHTAGQGLGNRKICHIPVLLGISTQPQAAREREKGWESRWSKE